MYGKIGLLVLTLHYITDQFYIVSGQMLMMDYIDVAFFYTGNILCGHITGAE